MPKQRCPCGAKYHFPNSAVGRRAKCAKCGATLTLRPKGDQGPITIADDPSAGTGTIVDSAVSPAADAPQAVAPGFIPPVPIIEPPIMEKPPPDYAESLLGTLLFLRSFHNLIMFVILWGFLFVASAFLPWTGIVGMFGKLAVFAGLAALVGQSAVFAWFSAFRLNLIAAAAAGETQLPGTMLTDGVLDGMVVPLLRWIGSWVIVLAPMSIALMFVLALRRLPAGIDPGDVLEMGPLGWLRSGSPELIGVGVLFYVGVFTWPIVVLCMALGGFGAFSRPDMILDTIGHTFPAYSLTVLIVIGSDIVRRVLTAEFVVTGLPDAYLMRHATATGIEAYLSVIAMSAIGLYYHHFKEKFAWSWD